MSKYTTGEVAKLCDISVRTVQYYDTRGLVIPSELSEGGRRLYSEDDLKRMRVVCFLREVGLAINSIVELLAEDDPGSVIAILLSQQEELLKEEIEERQEKLKMLETVAKEIKNRDNLTVESIGDIACIMEGKRKMRKVRITMLTVGVLLEIVEIGTAVLWATTGIWWPFALGMGVVIGATMWVVDYYYKRTDFICPKCHTVFKPGFKEMFFSSHTPTTRKLTCTNCGHKGFCVETYAEDKG